VTRDELSIISSQNKHVKATWPSTWWTINRGFFL